MLNLYLPEVPEFMKKIYSLGTIYIVMMKKVNVIIELLDQGKDSEFQNLAFKAYLY